MANRRFFLKCGALALMLAAAATGRADWPDYESAGFRHAALIYQRNPRRADDFKPMIARHRRETGTFEPVRMFDCFLFLNLRVNGIRTENGKTRLADWQKQLDLWFGPESDVDALHRAAVELKRDFGGRLPQPLTVLFSIPYMHPEVTDFGDIDGDGVLESCAVPEDVRKVADWYIRTVEEKMQAFPELKLLGFYWMNESVRHDARTLGVVSGLLKERGHRFIWIPWFRAAGWESWRDFGFDCAMMQSNYAFTSFLSGGSSRRNRLDVCADLAFANGLGVEIEFPHRRDAADVEIIRQTYDAGSRRGFQHAPTAYYFGHDFKEYASPDPMLRQVYDWTCDYINGKDLRIGEEQVWQRHSAPGVFTAETAFTAPRRVHYLDLLLDELPEQCWRGLVVVEGKPAPEADWRPLAWRVRGAPAAANGRFQNITFPVGAEVTALRVTMTAAARSGEPNVTGLHPDFFSVNSAAAKSFRRPYTSTLPGAVFAYPDNEAGRKLLDGKTSGVWSAFVGWQNAPIGLVFDLGPDPVAWDEVRIHARREPGGGIEYPGDLMLAAADDPLPEPLEGTGPPPANVAVLSAAAKSITRDDPAKGSQDAVFTFRAEQPLRQRYLALSGKAVSWCFLAEVEFRRDGRPLPTDRMSYRIGAPLKRQPDNFGDDGRLLTDGVSEPGRPERYVLLPVGATAEVTVELGGEVPLAAAKVFFGRTNPAFGPPAAVRMEAGETGVEARPAAATGNAGAFEAALPAEVRTRRVTFRITAGDQPVQLTEIVAE
jgi:hypothetical protein